MFLPTWRYIFYRDSVLLYRNTYIIIYLHLNLFYNHKKETNLPSKYYVLSSNLQAISNLPVALEEKMARSI